MARTASFPLVPWLVILLLAGSCAPGGTSSSPSSAPAAPAAVGGATAAAPASAPTSPAKPSRLDPFTGVQVSIAGNYLPFYVADKKGFFARHGLQFELIVTDSPAKVVQTVASGSADVAWSAPDATILAIEQGAPLVMVAAGQNSIPYSLIVQPTVRSFADLKGKSLAVSSLNSGPAVLSRKILGANGVAANEFDLLPVGGTAERFAAIRSGVVGGGLLLQPDDLRLMAEGFPRLALTTDYIPRYQWLTMVAARDWARENEDRLVRGLRALNDAYRWVYDPQNRDEAIALMVETTRAPVEHAVTTYELYVDTLRIWPVDGRFDDAAMQAVIELMGELGQLQPPLPAPSRYIDLTYIDKAARP